MSDFNSHNTEEMKSGKVIGFDREGDLHVVYIKPDGMQHPISVYQTSISPFSIGKLVKFKVPAGSTIGVIEDVDVRTGTLNGPSNNDETNKANDEAKLADRSKRDRLMGLLLDDTNLSEADQSFDPSIYRPAYFVHRVMGKIPLYPISDSRLFMSQRPKPADLSAQNQIDHEDRCEIRMSPDQFLSLEGDIESLDLSAFNIG